MKHPGAILAVALAMSGCAGSEPVAIAPPIAAPAVYATDLPAAGLQEEWWLGFGDPVLDRLVRRGLEANLDIDAASGRLAAAAALLRAERADGPAVQCRTIMRGFMRVSSSRFPLKGPPWCR